jgi:hypothetical protein
MCLLYQIAHIVLDSCRRNARTVFGPHQGILTRWMSLHSRHDCTIRASDLQKQDGQKKSAPDATSPSVDRSLLMQCHHLLHEIGMP